MTFDAVISETSVDKSDSHLNSVGKNGINTNDTESSSEEEEWSEGDLDNFDSNSKESLGKSKSFDVIIVSDDDYDDDYDDDHDTSIEEYSTISDSEDFKDHKKHEKEAHFSYSIKDLTSQLESNERIEQSPLRTLTNVHSGRREREPLSERKTTVNFSRARENITLQAFKEFDLKVFQSSLENVEVTWSKRLTTTAGLARLKRLGEKRLVSIELSTKLIDDENRLRLTLMHEMCHAGKEHFYCFLFSLFNV